MNNSKISIYQVLPRLFGNSIKTPIVNGTISENGCGKFSSFSDKALSEIKKLGITHIWYTGIIRHATTTNYKELPAQDPCIVKGKSGSPYAITDYYDVNPDLADDVNHRMKEFEELLHRTKESGLKSIIDFVPNHVSRDYKSLAKPKNIPDFGIHDNTAHHFNSQNNFYYLPNQKLELNFCESQVYQEFPAKVSGNDCFHHQPNINDWYETIKLNYGDDVQGGNIKHFSPIPNTWFRMLEILQFWAKKEIDGFRCDMVEMVPVEFWNWVIPQIKIINPDIIFIGEVYQPELYEAYINQGKFDYLYDKVGLYDQLKAVLRGEKPTSSLSDCWKNLNGLDKNMLRFLENHDEQRIPSPDFAGNAPKAIPAMVLSATMHQGPIMTYFGQEFGENASGTSGFSGDDGRTTIFDYWTVPSIQRWMGKSAFTGKSLLSEEKNLQKEYRKLLNFTVSSPIISSGDFYDLMWANRNQYSFDSNTTYAYFRSFEGKSLLFVLNFSNQLRFRKVMIPEHALSFIGKDDLILNDSVFKDVFSGEKIKIETKKLINEGIDIEIPANYYRILEF